MDEDAKYICPNCGDGGIYFWRRRIEEDEMMVFDDGDLEQSGYTVYSEITGDRGLKCNCGFLFNDKTKELQCSELPLDKVQELYNNIIEDNKKLLPKLFED